jgi:quinol monooxygenase YgiN
MLNSSEFNLASYIRLTAENGQQDNLSKLLAQGAQVVATTEPDTQLWFALKDDNGNFGIFDVFADEKARTAHFGGQFAHTLKEIADLYIKSGWQTGVLRNLENFDVLSVVKAANQAKATRASFICLRARPGSESALEALLSGAAHIIEQTEPNTLFWTAMRLDNSNFAIFDTFVDGVARKAHFSGEVATALKEHADTMIEGGWEKGVLPNVLHFNVLAGMVR